MKEIITTIREIWDEIAKDHGMIPTRGRLSERRERAIKARWEEVFKGWYGEPPQTIEEEYEWFRWYFLSIASNPFYCGKNDRGWRAGIDYALRPSAMERLVEQAAVPLTTPATDAEIMRQIEEWERRMGISDAVD